MSKETSFGEGVRMRTFTGKESFQFSKSIIESNNGGEKEDKTKVLDAWKIVESKSFYLLIFFTVLGFVTRFYLISHPGQVVFDEVHFGKFASYYLKREFYFDVHPPLAKMTLALGGYFIGFEGDFLFEKIGLEYSDYNVPYVGLRATSAIFGALNVPLVYLTMRESGYSLLASILSTCLVSFDSQLIFYATLSIYCYIKFYKYRYGEFTFGWWFWMLATGVSLACTLGVKMVGLFTIITVGLAVIYDLWNVMDIRRGYNMKYIGNHFFARVVGLIITPAIVYIFFYWIHFTVLYKSGTGDTFMSPEFQATLYGNERFSKSQQIKYGDDIKIKHEGIKAFLHSHKARYPQKYPDGRISSQGQQVTGYSHPDENNYWRVHPHRKFPESEADSNHFVKNGDVIRLEHISTSSFLLAHDVASPTMPTNEEITTVDAGTIQDETTQLFNNTLFKIEVHNQDVGTIWETNIHLTKILHVETPIAIWTHPKKLAEWGFGQFEVNGNKKLHEESNHWFVSSIKGTNSSDIAPKAPAKRNFFLKFWELHTLMLIKNNQISSEHPFSTRPWQWPITHRGASYWTKEKDNFEQIYILGNPFGYWLGTVVALIFICYLIADQLCLRRGIDSLRKAKRYRIYHSGLYFLGAWILHFIPFFPMGRQLFLHHYLPALIFKYLLVGAAFDFFFLDEVDAAVPEYPSLIDSVENRPTSSNYSSTLLNKGKVVNIPKLHRYRQHSPVATTFSVTGVAFLIMAAQILLFVYYSPLVYGTGLPQPGQVYQRKWLSSWDFHFAKPPTKPAPIQEVKLDKKSQVPNNNHDESSDEQAESPKQPQPQIDNIKAGPDANIGEPSSVENTLK